MNLKGLINERLAIVGAAALLLGAAGLGCSATPIGLAMTVAGDAVNDVDEANRSEELMGASVTQADAKLGAPLDVLSDTRSTRTWRVYSVPMDALDSYRYVLEVEHGRIIAVEKTQKLSDPVEREAILLVMRPKVMGKSASECEANLQMGAPRLTLRSKTSGQLIQLYDARVVKELQSPHYCVLRFGSTQVCEKIDLVKVYTAGGTQSP